MRKIIAAINMTLDGFCDHTELIADDEIHQHYNDLLRNAGCLVYGRITYQLMESSWPPIVSHPTGNKPIDDFAVIMDKIPKLVFSRTLKAVDWKNARLATKDIKEEILELKRQAGGDILVGSPGLIVSLMNLDLIEEFQLCVQPIILGKGSIPLFKKISHRMDLKVLRTKTFSSGSIIYYYEPARK